NLMQGEEIAVPKSSRGWRQGRHPFVLSLSTPVSLDFSEGEIRKELPFWAPLLGGFRGLESEDRSPDPACRVPSSPDSLEPVWETQAQYRPATKRRQLLSQHRPQIHTDRCHSELVGRGEPFVLSRSKHPGWWRGISALAIMIAVPQSDL